MTRNVDLATVEGFGDEWSRFDQAGASDSENEAIFRNYFSLMPPESLGPDSIGADIGCGSGRWASFVAPHVKTLHLVDPSREALEVAKRVAPFKNCTYSVASANEIPLPDGSLDFAYSLGVLHHVPDTPSALAACVRKLKPGAPFLLYLYYAFDHRPAWFRAIWRLSDVVRRGISRLPRPLQNAVTDAIAGAVYFPLARAAALAERRGRDVGGWPLSQYRHMSFYVMRNDARDRFGTRLEKRFTQAEIRELMLGAGLDRVTFRYGEPYWTAIGYRALNP